MRASGDDKNTDDLLAAARKLGITVIEIEPSDTDDEDSGGAPPAGENPLQAAIRQATDAEADVIGMAGGDGSLGRI